MIIEARSLDHRQINALIAKSTDVCDEILGCIGQRYIAAGTSNKKITVRGVGGNALGAYLDGSSIIVEGNAQDALGDTMNSGEIYVNGSSGDALGYAMRGGEIYVKENSGYRAGVHIKEYGNKKPIIIIGGSAGAFLGEYQAGGLVVVLNINDDDYQGEWAAGMHGGKIVVRGDKTPYLAANTIIRSAADSDLAEIKPYLEKFCRQFKLSLDCILKSRFRVVEPASNNPYKRLYVNN